MAPQREWFEKDYYEVLGVPPAATEKDITRAYRKLAKQYHPDANPGDTEAEERFKEISAAHDVLGDAEKRKEYDQVREMVASGRRSGRTRWLRAGSPVGSAGGVPERPLRRRRRHARRRLFGNLFGGRGGRRRSRPRGPAGPQRGQRPRDRAAPRLPRRGARRHHVGEHHVGGAVLACATARGAKPGTLPERLPRRAAAPARSRSTRDRSRSRRCAPPAVGAAAIVKDKCKHCKGRGVEVRPRDGEGAHPGRRRRRSAHPREGPGRARAQRRSARRPLRRRARARRTRSSAAAGKSDLTVKVPITFAEAALGAQVKVPTLDAPVTRQGAGRARRAARRVRVQGPRHPRRAKGDRRRPARHVRRRSCPTELDDEQRARRSRSSPSSCPATRASTWGCEAWPTTVDERALYIISVAAELAGVHPQTLRIYERKGLIEPSRTEGRSRRYSDRDIALLRRIQELTNEGVSLVGVRKILELEAELEALRARVDALEDALDAGPRRGPDAPSARSTAATAATWSR